MGEQGGGGRHGPAGLRWGWQGGPKRCAGGLARFRALHGRQKFGGRCGHIFVRLVARPKERVDRAPWVALGDVLSRSAATLCESCESVRNTAETGNRNANARFPSIDIHRLLLYHRAQNNKLIKP